MNFANERNDKIKKDWHAALAVAFDLGLPGLFDAVRRPRPEQTVGSALHASHHAGWQADTDQMNAPRNNMAPPHRGGAPVGYVAELGPVEAGAVLYLRLWCDGPDAQMQVWQDFATALGPQTGRKALKSFETLCDLCARHGRRPLMRHHVSCKCLGADESCFANFIGYASEGEREDALLIAMNIVRPDIAPALVGVAQDFGLALRRMAIRANGPTTKHKTLH